MKTKITHCGQPTQSLSDLIQHAQLCGLSPGDAFRWAVKELTAKPNPPAPEPTLQLFPAFERAAQEAL
jgi:hypothetical protein